MAGETSSMLNKIVSKIENFQYVNLDQWKYKQHNIASGKQYPLRKVYYNMANPKIFDSKKDFSIWNTEKVRKYF